MHISPAQYVIKIFGGVRATARAIGRSPGAISKWKKSRTENGCGGDVPSGAQRRILELAKENGLDITPHDLMFGRKIKAEAR